MFSHKNNRQQAEEEHEYIGGNVKNPDQILTNDVNVCFLNANTTNIALKNFWSYIPISYILYSIYALFLSWIINNANCKHSPELLKCIYLVIYHIIMRIWYLRYAIRRFDKCLILLYTLENGIITSKELCREEKIASLWFGDKPSRSTMTGSMDEFGGRLGEKPKWAAVIASAKPVAIAIIAKYVKLFPTDCVAMLQGNTNRIFKNYV